MPTMSFLKPSNAPLFFFSQSFSTCITCCEFHKHPDTYTYLYEPNSTYPYTSSTKLGIAIVYNIKRINASNLVSVTKSLNVCTRCIICIIIYSRLFMDIVFVLFWKYLIMFTIIFHRGLVFSVLIGLGPHSII